jgi:dihydrofolate reductase
MAAKLVIHCNTTLDGVIDDPQEWVDLSPAGQAHVAEWYAEAAGMVLGRVCFEGFASVWPGMRDVSPIGPYINDLPKWVASRTLEGELGWNGTLLERDDAMGHLARIKAETDGTLLSTGLGELAADAMRAGLVDELRLLVAPVVRGYGRHLFHDVLRDQRFEVAHAGPAPGAQELVLWPVR